MTSAVVFTMSRQNKQFKRPMDRFMLLTRDRMDELDKLEDLVYSDLEYTLANEMLDAIVKSNRPG